MSLKAIGIKPGDEVITAANTFVATVGAITEIGAVPKFVDCDDTFCMDVNKVEEKFQKNKSNCTSSLYWIYDKYAKINKIVKKV